MPKCIFYVYIFQNDNDNFTYFLEYYPDIRQTEHLLLTVFQLSQLLKQYIFDLP